jgi:hypothetical protein
MAIPNKDESGATAFGPFLVRGVENGIMRHDEQVLRA